MNTQDKIFEIADKITEFNFESIWGVEGTNIENGMNKKEAAEEMFFKGIAYILEHLDRLGEVDINKVKSRISEVI